MILGQIITAYLTKLDLALECSLLKRVKIFLILIAFVKCIRNILSH